MDKQAFTPIETGKSALTEEEPRSVVIELNPAGGARIRKAPPDMMVMVVESQMVTAAGKRSLAAGVRSPYLDTHTGECAERPEPRQIAVSFPG